MKKILSIIIMLILATAIVGATQFVKHDESTIKVEAGTFEDDYFFVGSSLDFSGESGSLYFAGDKLDLSGNIRNGLYFAGDTLDLTGNTKGGLTAFGKNIMVTGNVNGNLHVGAKVVDIYGTVDGTTIFGGEIISLKEGAVINGTLIIGAGSMFIDGDVNGNIYSGSNTLIINGTVNGDVRAVAESITFGDKGRIKGNLTYSTDRDLRASDKEKVSGALTFKEFTDENGNKYSMSMKDDSKEFFTALGFIFTFLKLLSVLVIGLLMLLLPLVKKIENEDKGHKDFWLMPVMGLVTVIIYTVGIFILPLTPLLLIGIIPSILITTVLGLTLFGQYMFKVFKWSSNKRYLQFLFAFGVFAILSIIPGIRGLMAMFFSFIGWGYIIEKLFNKKSATEITG